jgi:hypothetical protein
MRNWTQSEDGKLRELTISQTLNLVSSRIDHRGCYLLHLHFLPDGESEGYRISHKDPFGSHDEIDEKLPSLLDWLLETLRKPVALAGLKHPFEIKGLSQLPTNAAAALG